MIMTFDFVLDAQKNRELMSQLLNYMEQNTDRVINTNTCKIIFRADSQKADILPLSETSPFHCKIVPKQITYSALHKMLNGDFDHFEDGDIIDIS